MNITNINIYAEGYYGGSTYEENRRIRTEVYNQFKNDIDKIVVYICELDGKHSQVKAIIKIDNYNDEQIKNMSWDSDVDGESLFYKLEDIFEDNNLILQDELDIVETYIDSLDTHVDFVVRIKKSNIAKVSEYCKDL